jgi:hypothetical protein
MRTTISIEDELLRRAKEASVERNCTLGEVVEDALRVSLTSRPKSGRKGSMRPFKTFKGTGTQPGIDLSSSSSLLEAMEEG